MPSYDIVIIGGGSSGCGVALEAAGRGFSVKLIERGKCLSGTSGNSLRIIHGGLRYLQSLSLARAVASRRDQFRLFSEMSEVVTPLPCVMPLSSRGMRSFLPMRCATIADYFLSLIARTRLPPARIVSGSEVDQEVPVLRGKAPYGAMLWHDAVISDMGEFTRLIREQLLRAGIDVCEETCVEKVVRLSSGLSVLACHRAEYEEISCKAVVNTSGPWSDKIAGFEAWSKPPRLGWCKAFNLILTRQLEPRYAVAIYGVERRLYLMVPRAQTTVIGTWYEPSVEVEHASRVSEAEIAAALDRFNCACPGIGLIREDVSMAESGLLPAMLGERDDFELLGRERIFFDNGIVHVISTKLTTFRSQGAKAMDLIGSYINKEASNAA